MNLPAGRLDFHVLVNSIHIGLYAGIEINVIVPISGYGPIANLVVYTSLEK